MVRSMIEAFQALKAAGETILLVEQNFYAASALGDHVVVMDDGRIAHAGAMSELVGGSGPAAAPSRPQPGRAPMSDHDRSTHRARGRAAARQDRLAPAAPGARRSLLLALPVLRRSLVLGDADRGGPCHGHDDLPHGVRPDARLRPDGRHQFRPRRLHLARRLRDAPRARAACRLGDGRFARPQPRAPRAVHPASPWR